MFDRFRFDPTVITLCIFALAVPFALSSPAAADDLFIESDDYVEDDEITNVFLQDEHYSIMIEDLERNGQEFDWGWALTPGWSDDAAEEPQEKKGRFRRGRRGPKTVQEPKQLAFDIQSYGTVRIPEVENFSGLMSPDELDAVRDAFVLAFEQLGLQVTAAGAPADLELGMAIVDINREGGGFGWIQIEPFIEIELRLRDLANDHDLLLIRNQEHGEDSEDSALQYANQLVLFMR